MKRLMVTAIIVSATATSVLAQTPQPSTTAYRRAPAPLVAAGPVGMVIGAGYAVYWLVKRRRRNSES